MAEGFLEVRGEWGGARASYPPFIPSPDAHILFLLFDWEKDASGRYEHKTLINLMKSSSPWLLPGEDGRAVAKGGT